MVRALRRKLRKDVLPELRAPTTSTLLHCESLTPVLSWPDHHLLVRGGVLATADPARAVDGAHGTAGVAVAAAMGHALGATIRVDGIRSGRSDRRGSRKARLRTRQGRVLDQGIALLASKGLQLRGEGEIGQARGDFGRVGFALTTEFLLHSLSFGQLLAIARGFAFAERLSGLGTTEEAERSATSVEVVLAVFRGGRKPIGRRARRGVGCHFGSLGFPVVTQN